LIADKSICYNTSPGELSATDPSGGTGLTYQWQSSADGTSSSWTNITTNGTSATYNPGALTATRYYRRTATSGNSCGSVTTAAVKITVYEPLNAGTLIADKGICYNTSPGELSATAASGGGENAPTYQWQSSTTTINSGFSDISGAISATYAPTSNLTQTTYYRRAAKNTCRTVYSNTITITVNPVPTVTITNEGSVCAGSTRTLGYTSTVTPVTSVQWTSNTPSVATVGATTGVVTGLTAGTATITCTVTTAEGCKGSKTYTITVNALPDKPTPNNVEICYDGQPHEAGANVKTGETVVWYDAETSGNKTVAPKLTNVGTAQAYAATKITATDCESATRQLVTVTVYDLPDKPTANDVEVCYDGQPHEASANVKTGETVVWYDAPTGGNATTAPKLTNAGTAQAYAAAKITATGCESATRQLVTVTVYQKPSPGTISGDPTVCVDSEITLTLTNADVNGEWKSSNNGIATVNNGLVTGVAAGIADIWYVVKNTSTGCSDSVYKTVTVNPKPNAGAVSGATEVCVNSEIILTNSTATGGSGITSSWKSEDSNTATVDNSGKVRGVSAGNVDIWYIVTNTSTGCRDSVSYSITVKDEDNLDYPDIRLRLCPSVGTVNLSKYLDTVGVQSVSWSGFSIQSNGELDASNLNIPGGTYTFKYTAIAGCPITAKVRKAYVKMLNNGESPRFRDTVTICYIHAEAININQLFGLESSGLSYDYDAVTVAPHVTQTSLGGTVFDGKTFYATQPKILYHGANVVMVTFTYTPAECLDGKTYKLVIVLSDEL
jgi:uncharacterized protein YjdB